MRLKLLLAALAAFALTPAPIAAQDTAPAETLWAFEESDIPVDPAFHFGVLDNGMRYVLRSNATPEGTALVRMLIDSGSIDETDSERGLAHFVEHMAFNGSARIPEGEMIPLLEREGLAFGPDTNASTGIDRTLYMLNLPRNDEALLATALMLMRETASELLIEQDAVERERGIILAERRDRRNFAYKQLEDQLDFVAPGARLIDRLPIGALEVLENASAADLRGYYERNYVPANTTLVIVGDFPLELMEQRVQRWFADWQAAPLPGEAEYGPLDIARSGETDIYVDPALPESVSVLRYAPWQDRPDTIAMRQQNLLRQIGYGIINRRLQRLALGGNAPFRSASINVSDFFEEARSTDLTVNAADGEWRAGLIAAAIELRQALQYGFSEAEVAEQLARIRTSLENSVSGVDTRTNSSLVSLALDLVLEERVPSTPQSSLERFENFAGQITPEATLAAIKADMAELVDPLIRFQGRAEPEGGADALRSAWNEAIAAEIVAPGFSDAVEFAYQDFGDPGEIISDMRNDEFGFRLIRFANGVRLNLKQTDIRKDRVSFQVTLDGGSLLNTADDPLKTVLASSIPAGGLGAHSQDELQSVLAGRSVRFPFSSTEDAFVMSGGTTPRDLELQLQVLAAGLTDPGYRSEGEERYRRNIAQFFASMDATPGQALGNALGQILSDGDPRFTLQSEEAYAQRSYEQLQQDIGDRLSNGAIELALVGDFDEQAAIDAVAKTFGALPPRESEFLAREEARQRSFTAQRDTHTITHSGEPDQALIRMVWPTTDDSDLVEAMRLELLARAVRVRLQETLREELGQAYSPSADSSTSRVWRDYGTFSISVSVDFAQLDAARAAIAEMLDDMRRGIDEDLIDRARQPLLESFENMLKSLGGWMSLADRAQSEADRLGRYSAAPGILKGFTAADIHAAANAYLTAGEEVELLVVPQGETEAASAE